MGRVSLTEDYDDRSVISKLNEMDKRVKENTTVVTAAEASAKQSAQAAQETADRFAGSVGAVVQNANQQINASKAQVDQAKAEVDETVTTVAQAVQTANQASASAQTSAQTVQGYDDRLTAVETKNSQQDTDISALQTADTHNVKLEGGQTISGQKTFSDDIILKHSSTPIYIVRNDVASTTSPTTATDFGYTFRDKDNKETGTIFQHIGTDKNSYLCARTKSWATGSRKDCEITLINNADGSRYVTVSPTTTVTAPSNAIVTKGYVESTDGETNNLMHRSANESINGYKQFEYSPSIKKICVNNNNLNTKWVRLCYYKENTNHADMHMITRFISGHTVNADFMFTVDIKQRSTYEGRTLTLVDNASYIPLCINKAPVMEQNNCGLVALWVPHNDVPYIEIWGKLPSNRLCITVQNYVNIVDIPTTEGVYTDSNTVGFDKVSSFVTWDCNTYSDTLPGNATRTQYLQKGKEDAA